MDNHFHRDRGIASRLYFDTEETFHTALIVRTTVALRIYHLF